MSLRSAILQFALCTLAGAVAVFWPSPTHAAPISCGFTITNLSFGTVDLTLNTAFDITATLSANCTGDAGVVVRVCPNINAGSGGTTTGSPRFMLSGSDKLNFDLYQDASRTVVWGSYLWAYSSYTAPTIDITLNGGGAGSATATVYGRISAGQQVLAAIRRPSAAATPRSPTRRPPQEPVRPLAIPTRHPPPSPPAPAIRPLAASARRLSVSARPASSPPHSTAPRR